MSAAGYNFMFTTTVNASFLGMPYFYSRTTDNLPITISEVVSVSADDRPPLYYIKVELKNSKTTEWFYRDRDMRDSELQMMQEML
jgi:hypothetical protein